MLGKAVATDRTCTRPGSPGRSSLVTLQPELQQRVGEDVGVIVREHVRTVDERTQRVAYA